MTPEQVAVRMGVSVARVSQIESGDVFTQDVLSGFVAALGGTLKLIAEGPHLEPPRADPVVTVSGKDRGGSPSRDWSARGPGARGHLFYRMRERYGLLLAGICLPCHEILRRPSRDLDFATRDDTPLPEIAGHVQSAFQSADTTWN